MPRDARSVRPRPDGDIAARCPYPPQAHEPGETFAARATLALLLFVVSFSSPAAVREVDAIGLTVGDLDREVEFYTRTLPFEKVSEAKSAPGAADELLGLSGTQLRSAELKLGDERITLTEHLASKGRPVPLINVTVKFRLAIWN